MKAVILAAGRGSRMNTSTNDRPKCLTKFRTKSLLDYQLEALRSNDINNIALVTGYLASKLDSYNLVKFHNESWKSTQMVYSFICASDWLNNSEFLVSYSDLFYDQSAIHLLKIAEGDICVLYDPNWIKIWRQRFDNPLDDAESFKINAINHITEIGKKTSNINDISGQFMGLLKFTPNGWNKFKRYYFAMDLYKRAKIDITSFLSELILHNVIDIVGVPFSGMWGEIDMESDIPVYDLIYNNC